MSEAFKYLLGSELKDGRPVYHIFSMDLWLKFCRAANWNVDAADHINIILSDILKEDA